MWGRIGVAVAAALMVGAGQVNGNNLVQNGGFETGDFTDWTVMGHGGTEINGTGLYVEPNGYGGAQGELMAPTQATTTATSARSVVTAPFLSPSLTHWVRPINSPTGWPETARVPVIWKFIGTTFWSLASPAQSPTNPTRSTWLT